MDLRRLRAGEWIAGVSGVVLFISLFLPWYRTEATGGIAAVDFSAWEVFTVVDLLLCVLALSGVALFIVTANQKSPAVGIALDGLITLIAGIAVVVVLIRVANVPGEIEAIDRSPLEAGRAPTILIGVLATLGVFVGSLIAMRDERLSKPGRPTDSTGLPIEAQPEIEVIRSP